MLFWSLIQWGIPGIVVGVFIGAANSNPAGGAWIGGVLALIWGTVSWFVS